MHRNCGVQRTTRCAAYPRNHSHGETKASNDSRHLHNPESDDGHRLQSKLVMLRIQLGHPGPVGNPGQPTAFEQL
jgi:hypothetical protein